MKKVLFLFAVWLMAFPVQAQRCAVLEFNTGGSVTQEDIDGIFYIFNSNFIPEGYQMLERPTINQAIKDAGYNRTDLTLRQRLAIGRALTASIIVAGEINLFMDEYNIDVRVISVETGATIASNPVSFKRAEYRENVKALAKKLASKLNQKDTEQNIEMLHHLQSNNANDEIQTTAQEKFELGLKYYRAKEYAKAVELYRKAAEQGYAPAQNEIGVCYEKGIGVLQNYDKAAEWYQKAAEQGNAFGQANLGVCYHYAHGVNQNYAKAVEWYKKSAVQGCVIAQNNLGVCYENGQGVIQDYTSAVEWYQKAAEQGFEIAQNNLGVCYENGHGVPKSTTKAIEWYRKAAKQGYDAAKKNLRRLGK